MMLWDNFPFFFPVIHHLSFNWKDAFIGSVNTTNHYELCYNISDTSLEEFRAELLLLHTEATWGF